MSRRSIALFGFAIAAAAGCGDSATAPPAEVGGVVYTARLVTDQNLAGPELTVIATLRNVNASAVMRTYPLACPVRIQLFRYSDNVLVYDETRLPCDMSMTTTTTIDLDPVMLTRTRFVADIAGDSLAPALYRVKATVLTEAQPVVVDAGPFNLRAAALRGG